jgi:hypothetical protein
MALWIRRVATVLRISLACGVVVPVVANRIDKLLMVFAETINDGE